MEPLIRASCVLLALNKSHFDWRHGIQISNSSDVNSFKSRCEQSHDIEIRDVNSE